MNILITGTRGIPAQHGGFETFAEDLALHLLGNGHNVTVYCQTDQYGFATEDDWKGIRRILIPGRPGPIGTMLFDFASLRHAIREDGVILTLGYNSAVLNAPIRLAGRANLMNMDGIEWRRAKWPLPVRLWFWANEWIGARLATHLIADHPEIKKHLLRHTADSRVTVIPYGANRVVLAPVTPLEQYGIKPNEYFLVVARPERENSILEIVRAHAAYAGRKELVVLGKYSQSDSYQVEILRAAGPNVKFIGAIYDKSIVQALRFYSFAYIHGHTVGGTNPSLVEALATGTAVIAHDNCFNRWVAGENAMYFSNIRDLTEIMDCMSRDLSLIATMKAGSARRHAEAFTQELVLGQYEKLLLRFAECFGT